MEQHRNGPVDELARTLAPVLGAVEIVALRRLSGGASRETWSFAAKTADGASRDLILRRDPPGRPGLPGSMRREADAMRATRAAGLLAPEVLVDDDGSLLGTAGLVMGSVPGETLARRILRDDEYAPARKAFAKDCGTFLAGLHAIDPASVPGLREEDPLAALRARVDLLPDRSPTFALAYRWLAANVPASHGTVVVHGDYRLGNVIIGPEGLRAAIDWELVHLGDPLEDLGWLCVKAWRFGAPQPVGGMGTFDELVDAYEGAGGRRVDRSALHWWVVLNTLKWGLGCMGQANVHLSGVQRSVELAAIGRRVCEQEWDLLQLLDSAATDAAVAATPDDAAPTTDPGLHGRPTAADLVEATREFLLGDVMSSTEGRVQFHARVASNVLATIGRQLALGARQEERFRAGLARLGATDDRSLAAAVEAGALDDRRAELLAFLAESVRDKLLVANPPHLTRPA